VKKSSIEIVKDSFNKIDGDHNGRLTQAELNTAAKIENLPAKVRAAYAQLGSSDNYELLTSKRHAAKAPCP